MKKFGNFVLMAVTALVFILLLGPLAIVIVTAFSPSDSFQFPRPGFRCAGSLISFRAMRCAALLR